MMKAIFLYAVGAALCFLAVWVAGAAGMALADRDIPNARVMVVISLAMMAAGMAALVIA